MKNDHHPYTVVVGIDYCETSELVLNEAFELAAERPGAVVHVLNVLPLHNRF